MADIVYTPETKKFNIKFEIKDSGKVTFSWDKLEDIISGFIILRFDQNGTEKILCSTGPNEIKFTDGNPLYGETCRYKILAYKRFMKKNKILAESNEVNVVIPEKQVSKVEKENRPITVQSTLKRIDSMEGHAFESFCADLLKLNGYPKVSVTKGSGDQGLDLIAHRDGVDFGIQCKCYSSDIGNKAVQEAFAGKTYYGCHVAIVLTNQYFTKAAKDLAEINKVVLWDRNKLTEFVKKTIK